MKALLLCVDERVAEAAAFCRGKGLGIEVQAFHDPNYASSTPDAVALHEVALKGISVRAFHGCFADLCPGSIDPMVRDIARKRFEFSYETAMQLDIHNLILHHGFVPHNSSPGGWLQRCSTFWKEFLREKSDKMRFHIENTLDWDPSLLSEVVDAIDDARVDVNLDVGHAHCEGRLPVVEWVERLGDQIGYVHLHDNHGHDDEHLGFGKGTLPLKEVCEALEKEAPNALWAIEVGREEDVLPAFEWLGENGFLNSRKSA